MNCEKSAINDADEEHPRVVDSWAFPKESEQEDVELLQNIIGAVHYRD